MFYRHGLSNHPLYQVWADMRARCENSKTKRWKDYGGRGISVCEIWTNSFTTFYKWAIENGYSKGLQLDRINNNGNYEPDNCRWATNKENANNRNNTIIITCNGETLSLVNWAERIGINPNSIHGRLKRGWPTDLAVTTPANGRKRKRLQNGQFK